MTQPSEVAENLDPERLRDTAVAARRGEVAPAGALVATLREFGRGGEVKVQGLAVTIAGSGGTCPHFDDRRSIPVWAPAGKMSPRPVAVAAGLQVFPGEVNRPCCYSTLRSLSKYSVFRSRQFFSANSASYAILAYLLTARASSMRTAWSELVLSE